MGNEGRIFAAVKSLRDVLRAARFLLLFRNNPQQWDCHLSRRLDLFSKKVSPLSLFPILRTAREPVVEPGGHESAGTDDRRERDLCHGAAVDYDDLAIHESVAVGGHEGGDLGELSRVADAA